ncbi:DUF1120 domain-containing protein [Erwinia sp. LJJL01]|uniref:DUF1120 domain-containing protein n=1 Tax=Erwinia sp. LJJL01 TaxID=3391839 RepID=UPI00105D3192
MKKMTLPLVAAAVLGLGSLSAAQAATQARLQVRGIIEPPACNVALEGGNVLNWGEIDASELNANRATQLASKNVNLKIACEASALVLVKPADVAELAGEVSIDGKSDASYFSLGATSEGKMIGAWTLSAQAKNARADDKQAAVLLESDTGGSSWNASSQEIHWKASGNSLYGIALGGEALPVATKELTMGLSATPYIASINDLGNADDITLSGLATFDVVYL